MPADDDASPIAWQCERCHKYHPQIDALRRARVGHRDGICSDCSKAEAEAVLAEAVMPVVVWYVGRLKGELKAARDDLADTVYDRPRLRR